MTKKMKKMRMKRSTRNQIRSKASPLTINMILNRGPLYKVYVLHPVSSVHALFSSDAGHVQISPAVHSLIFHERSIFFTISLQFVQPSPDKAVTERVTAMPNRVLEITMLSVSFPCVYPAWPTAPLVLLLNSHPLNKDLSQLRLFVLFHVSIVHTITWTVVF
jgi:hypothetical protein